MVMVMVMEMEMARVASIAEKAVAFKMPTTSFPQVSGTDHTVHYQALLTPLHHYSPNTRHFKFINTIPKASIPPGRVTISRERVRKPSAPSDRKGRPAKSSWGSFPDPSVPRIPIYPTVTPTQAFMYHKTVRKKPVYMMIHQSSF